MEVFLGLDIGGTHISGGLVKSYSGKMKLESFHQYAVDAGANAGSVLKVWGRAVEDMCGTHVVHELAGIGIAMPGPFDYEQGISLIKGLGKYDALYGMDIKGALRERLSLPKEFPIRFKNDAMCFALGEYVFGLSSQKNNVLALTLGTGLGAAFLRCGKPVTEGPCVPPGGMLYNLPYRGGIAEDTFSARGLQKEYECLTGIKAEEVKMICEHAQRGVAEAGRIFGHFGTALARFLCPWLQSFGADILVMGGGISKASPFFKNEMAAVFKENGLKTDVVISTLGEKASALGAAGFLVHDNIRPREEKICRKTNQYLLPERKDNVAYDDYDLYPASHLEGQHIYEGADSLAAFIANRRTVIIDGYAGISWKDLQHDLQQALPQNLKVNIQQTEDWFLPEEEIDALLAPYLGEEKSVWGFKCDKALIDLFDQQKVAQCRPDEGCEINIVMGVGAALAAWDAPVIYVDLPKNELQFRMRAGCITNMGRSGPEDGVNRYKRFYFVDWVLLNAHKKNILNRIKIIADGQRPDTIIWMYADDLRAALKTMSENVFRARPWFEPGAWGGQWIKKNIRGINPDEVNYAWSFELITPENGLILESGGWMLEVSFDFLMFLYGKEVLGEKGAERFGDEFPIRFDFLDTVGGGNLSIQCHPSVKYIQERFGEHFTQDETYYILDADDTAGVYLGFQENIDPKKFRSVLEQSHEKNIPVDVTEYVQHHPARKHDLFLIPNGTIHSAGAGNMVLEISATPYIFTFKMYDWLRLDLDGKPRPINIGHAFNNLNFDRKGERVKEELIAKPVVVSSGPGWRQIHLPTHYEHFYDIHRYDFEERVTIDTAGSCHVLMLVEGSALTVKTKNGFEQRFHYAETFVVPAAAERYTLINGGSEEAKVVKAFLKP